MNELTLGEYRVGKNFNPSNNDNVDVIKTKAAELIDLIEKLKPIDPIHCEEHNHTRDQEKLRLSIIAQDQIESAAMFAVKAATKQ